MSLFSRYEYRYERETKLITDRLSLTPRFSRIVRSVVGSIHTPVRAIKVFNVEQPRSLEFIPLFILLYFISRIRFHLDYFANWIFSDYSYLIVRFILFRTFAGSC